ncbi:unnamed protein product [Polarella glacialis]|uniref:Uncharacterized protein n=1 Tax=Polarella glacialis TaxID=89957 RepID=A0A813JE34_POLGL|nr:unnamed protein product [Polarella glacialis]
MGIKSNKFFEDHRFLAETCTLVGAQGYATFSECCIFHEKGKQNEEEMVAWKGRYISQCPSSLGRQGRQKNIFLYPPVHEGPLHAPEAFRVPTGWDWPTEEATKHFTANIGQLQDEISEGSVCPASFRAWMLEVAIPCYFWASGT